MELAAESLASLTDGDLGKVFAYSKDSATVITLLQSQAKLVKEEYREDDEWTSLIQEKLPLLTSEDGDSGLVLLIAPRLLRDRRPRPSESPINRNRRDEKDDQKSRGITVFDYEESFEQGGQRQTRILPFSQTIFSRVAKAFHIHRSISPAMSRADVPLLSQEEVSMRDGLDGVRARVYNCRSTNAWGGDLAMTVTHFPHCRLSFGILFGCTNSQKQHVIQRLSLAIKESTHPLLLPGIFAELEKNRHNHIFESIINRLELVMPDSSVEDHSDSQDRRNVYLDILHLKHGLITWNQQLNKLLQHAWTLNAEYLGTLHPIASKRPIGSREGSETAADNFLRDSLNDEPPIPKERFDTPRSTNHAINRLNTSQDSNPYQEIMAKTNLRIIERINTISDDYDDKIRECQTRFDGLTLTTQLFQGETSVLLASAASQDSRHMRTIALVTMVFLPGTFFATIFSMTFFNWQAVDGESTVSPLFWIYIAFSVVSTIATLLMYHYFVAIRTKKVSRSSV